jgi:hypothetical protein
VAHVLVNVTILDMNDNCPMFVNLPYYAVVSVDAIKGSLVYKVGCKLIWPFNGAGVLHLCHERASHKAGGETRIVARAKSIYPQTPFAHGVMKGYGHLSVQIKFSACLV